MSDPPADMPANQLAPEIDGRNPAGVQALANLAHFLDTDGWHPQRLSGRDLFVMVFSGENGTFQCYAQVRVEAEQLICYAVAPVKVPLALRPSVAEFVTRANYGMYVGNFELDYNDGELRCKSSIDFEGEPLSDRLISNTIYPTVRLLDSYLPGLMRVLYAGASPQEAIAAIESEAE